MMFVLLDNGGKVIGASLNDRAFLEPARPGEQIIEAGPRAIVRIGDRWDGRQITGFSTPCGFVFRPGEWTPAIDECPKCGAPLTTHAPDAVPEAFDLVAHLRRQSAFSARTFGPGPRVGTVVAHIRKELDEIESNPADLAEWIDVALLAFDGAWRSGASAEQIAQALAAKLARNEARVWPDWRTVPDGVPIEHVKVDA